MQRFGLLQKKNTVFGMAEYLSKETGCEIEEASNGGEANNE